MLLCSDPLFVVKKEKCTGRLRQPAIAEQSRFIEYTPLKGLAYTTRRRRLSSITRAPCRSCDGRAERPYKKAPQSAGLELRGRGWPIPPPWSRLVPADHAFKSATTRSTLRKNC